MKNLSFLSLCGLLLLIPACGGNKNCCPSSCGTACEAPVNNAAPVEGQVIDQAQPVAGMEQPQKPEMEDEDLEGLEEDELLGSDKEAK